VILYLLNCAAFITRLLYYKTKVTAFTEILINPEKSRTLVIFETLRGGFISPCRLSAPHFRNWFGPLPVSKEGRNLLLLSCRLLLDT
jgi:hypothetical protein